RLRSRVALMFDVPQGYASHSRSLRPCRQTLLTILSMTDRFKNQTHDSISVARDLTGFAHNKPLVPLVSFRYIPPDHLRRSV
ncbi:MAG TPA: hypothetical protein PK866_15595, partial [Nitrospira sp.]|nr:hypothetical protein [Nitrospira sp.]